MTLRVLNVNDKLDLESGGGTAERTFQMSRFLAREGLSCTVVTIASPLLGASRIDALKPATVAFVPSLWRRFNVPCIAWTRIRRLVDAADVVHLMGHWSILNAMVYLACRRAGKPYVVCPAGALPLFGRSRGLKWLYNTLVGNSIIRNAWGWIAVTDGELPHFAAYAVDPSRVTVIPNGVDEGDFQAIGSEDFWRRFGLPEAPFILFMGRLNAIKGPDLLLQAFLQARHAFPMYHLVFAGPDGGLLESLKKTAERSGLAGLVHFAGYVSGADKSEVYHRARLLVVPSRQEAMSIVAVEAGFCGTPVLLTDQCGFSIIRTIDARLEVPATVEGIAAGLTDLLAAAGDLADISPVWSTYVRQHYSWARWVPEYVAFYASIMAGASNACAVGSSAVDHSRPTAKGGQE
jgi:glycosyltransferase involved in cell wall biosynthesis